MTEASIVSKDTLIPIGAVILVLSGAFSYGIMYNKVDTLREEMATYRTESKEEITELRKDIKALTAAVNKLEGSKAISYVGP